MEQLKVIGTEDDVLVLATESGERFSLAIDDVLRAELRKARRERDADVAPPSVRARARSRRTSAPACRRERSPSLSAPASRTSSRFEGPVLAEREHVVGQALAVPVLLGGDLEGDAPADVRRRRARQARRGRRLGERWTSWKEPTGWIVKLEFTANDIDHDARWGFDPRRSTLSPLNADAIQLSRQGSLPEGLIPRLRALDTVAAEGRLALRQRCLRPPPAPTRTPTSSRPTCPRPRPGRAAGRDQARARADRHHSRDRRPARGAAPPPRSARAAARSTRSTRRARARARSRCSTPSSRATTRHRSRDRAEPDRPSSPRRARPAGAARAAPRCRLGRDRLRRPRRGLSASDVRRTRRGG